MSLVDEIPEFGLHKVCPKCGGEQMFRKYCLGALEITDHPLHPTRTEYMQVKCGGCGFDQMCEKTKDAPMSEPEPTQFIDSH